MKNSLSVNKKIEELREEFSNKITVFTKRNEFYQKILEIENQISKNNTDIQGHEDKIEGMWS